MLKMKELIEQTSESKSTLLYYVKEGLLPEPKKPKPNVHLYDKSCVERVKFIKYLQNELSYSIAQIKAILENNSFEFDNSFDTLVNSIELIANSDKRDIDKESFLELAQISEDELKSYINRGYLENFNNKFSKKELKIVNILQEAKRYNFDFSLLDRYVEVAKELATLENDIGSKLLSDDSKTHNLRYLFLFDLILNLKPYIFNNATIKEHHNRVKEKIWKSYLQ